MATATTGLVFVFLSLLSLLRIRHHCHGLIVTTVNPDLPSTRKIFSHPNHLTTTSHRLGTTTTCRHAQQPQQQDDGDSNAFDLQKGEEDTNQQILPGPIHHVAIKTRNITTAIQFYSLLGFRPTVRFRAGPARAAWLEPRYPKNVSSSANARIELLEVPSYVLKEPEGQRTQAVDLMKRPELLGYNHLALDVTDSVARLVEKRYNNNNNNNNNTAVTTTTTTTLLADYVQYLNNQSLELFGKTLRVALEPRQQMIGSAVYELVSFVFVGIGQFVV
jgi:catechol 2,3-dioxygenase-like lactoylglutathione lyase family enzyme